MQTGIVILLLLQSKRWVETNGYTWDNSAARQELVDLPDPEIKEELMYGIEEVTRFKTTDDVEFLTHEEAVAYVEVQVARTSIANLIEDFAAKLEHDVANRASRDSGLTERQEFDAFQDDLVDYLVGKVVKL